MKHVFRRLRGDRKGTSAVEFALLAPVLAFAMVAAADLANMAFERSDMLGAVRSGTQYFMAGGTDLERARTIVESSWTSMPDNALIEVTRECECGGAPAQCNLLCADQSVPYSYAIIEVKANIGGIFVDVYHEAGDKVRVR